MKRTLIFVAAILLTTATFAQQKWAVINYSADYLRKSADFEAALDSQCLMGSVAEILATDDGWSQIRAYTPAYEGWVTSGGIVPMTRQELDEYIKAPKYICTAESGYIYEKPSSTSRRVCDFVMGDIVRKVLSEKGAPIRAFGFNKVKLPDGRTGYLSAGVCYDFQKWLGSRYLDHSTITGTAEKFLGTPYFWGGNSSKGLDCSGFVWLTYFMNGAILPRDATPQSRCGEEVAFWDLQEGDLLFFGKEAKGDEPERIQHVAIYLGKGKFIHSSGRVRINSLDTSSPDYYGRTPLHARRIIGNVSNGTDITSIVKSPWFVSQ